MSDMPWNDARVDLLTKLWRDGLSASQIAKQLGGVTRNAVIGKVHRLGLAGRPHPPKASRGGGRVRRPRASPRSAVRSAAPPASPRPSPRMRIDDGPGLASPLTLGPRMCKWPIGDPASESFSFCGRSVEAGPYCCAHAAVAYRPGQRPEARKAALASLIRRFAV